ncbi:MAG TPA: hypothetical protein VK669_15260 [Candidatus Limnocylindrales bacterium]|nr:hypothetical protein [Candidatus Limnocylindrales bacterium]
MTVTITAGGTTNVPVVLNGVVASLTIAVSPSSFTSGQPNSATVTVNALDPAGKIIAGDGGYADAAGNPVSLALGDSDTSGATQLSATALTAPAGPVTLGYNGAPISSFTITASASSSGIAAVNATVTVSNGPNPGGTSAIFVGQQSGTSCTATTQERVAGYQLASGGGVGSYTGALIVPANAAVSGGPAPLGFITADRTGDLFVLAFPQSGAAILRYPQTATGSAMPSASIGGTGTRLAHATRIAADGSGGVWAAEPASAGRAAQLEHFAGGANGTNVTPDHTITGISGLPAGWAFDANGLAVDSHDNVYTTAQDTASSNRLAYALPAASNGTATPLASYAFVNFGAAAEGVAVNQHTDAVWVWPVDPRSLGGTVQPGSTAPAIAQFAANATAPSRGLWGRAFPVSSSVLGPSGTTWYLANAAFDAAGNVYVQYEASRSDNAACESRVSVLTPAQSGDTAPLQSTVYPAPATGQANQSIGIVIP